MNKYDIVTFLPFLFMGIVAIFLVARAVLGLVKGKPTIRSSRFSMYIVMAIVLFQLTLLSSKIQMNNIATLVPFLIPVAFLLFFSKVMSNLIMVYGVDGEVLRNALTQVLKNKNISYQENLGSVKLLSQPGEIEISSQSPLGSCSLRIKNGSKGLMDEIIKGLRDYFKTTEVKTNKAFYVFPLIVGCVFLSIILSSFSSLVKMAAYPIPEQIKNSDNALRDYRRIYLIKKNHKAFAYSKYGMYGYCSGQISQDDAKACAIEYCSQRLKSENSPCYIISVDGNIFK